MFFIEIINSAYKIFFGAKNLVFSKEYLYEHLNQLDPGFTLDIWTFVLMMWFIFKPIFSNSPSYICEFFLHCSKRLFDTCFETFVELLKMFFVKMFAELNEYCLYFCNIILRVFINKVVEDAANLNEGDYWVHMPNKKLKNPSKLLINQLIKRLLINHTHF